MDNRRAPLAGLRILIVDSDRDSLALLCYFFAPYQIDTLTAESVAAALEILQAQPVDLVITEIALPIEDGFSLIGQLAGRIPAIAVTSFVPGCDPKQALDAGFSYFFSKPVDLNQLLCSVAQLTDRTC